jgi:hypothetical protein
MGKQASMESPLTQWDDNFGDLPAGQAGIPLRHIVSGYER